MYNAILENNNAIKSAQILIIDDSELSRKITEKFLSDQGFENIIFAEDGLQGIEAISKNKPKLVICDLFMPNMNGYEFCKEVRKNKDNLTLPIIIQTSSTAQKDVNKAYIAGGSDLVTKPLQNEEFITKVTFHLENSTYRARVQEELESARLMQESIMPSNELISELEDEYSMGISSHFAPSSEVGGDFWGVRKISKNELAIFNVDLSGHGVAAALNTFRVSSLIEDENNVFSSPAIFLKKINKRMKEFMPAGQFATMFYGVINTEDNILKFAGAGCPEPFIVKPNGEVISLDTKGIPIGAIEPVEYKEQEVPFEKGDLIIAFSDALIETPNDHQEFFDHLKIKKTLAKIAGLTAKKTLDKLMSKFTNFIGKNEITDDLTINIYKRL